MPEPRTDLCPACGGDGKVFRMTDSSFGWTGPTHEWRACHACGGRGVLGYISISKEGADLIAENTALRAAIDAAIADLRGRHKDGEGRCLFDWADWPCPDALLADRLEASRG